MEKITFYGYCPECELTDITSKMYYNVDDDLECPCCNLRVYHDNSKIAMIYRNRGKNNFALKFTPNINLPLVYTQSDVFNDQYSNGKIIQNIFDMKVYCEEMVNKQSFKNVNQILFESYIDNYLNNSETVNYALICEIAGLDISQINYSYENKNNEFELFKFLHFCLNCYNLNDYKSLSDFKYNNVTYPFYEKYILKNSNILNNNFLSLVVLQNLILTVITTLYKNHKQPV